MKRARPGQLKQFMDWAIRQETDECIIWPHACLSDGYPAITIARKSYRVIRLVCQAEHGEPADGLQAAHSCGKPKCINKRHLRWATQQENSADMKIHGTVRCGDKHPFAKLDARTVLEIRSLPERPDEIARRYGLKPQTVKGIRAGRTWKHLPVDLVAKDAWRPNGRCIVPGCARTALARKMCASHYVTHNKIKRKEVA
jgi:hypothetical protein